MPKSDNEQLGFQKHSRRKARFQSNQKDTTPMTEAQAKIMGVPEAAGMTMAEYAKRPKVASQQPKIVNRGAAGLLTKTVLDDAERAKREVDLDAAPKDRFAPSIAHLAVPIADLTPDPLNAREHSEANIDDIKRSLALYGQRKVISVFAVHPKAECPNCGGTKLTTQITRGATLTLECEVCNGTGKVTDGEQQQLIVTAGNGTLRAATELGWSQIAAAVDDDLTDAERMGYGLADNRAAEKARWNFDNVRRIEALMQEAGHQDGMVGWSPEEIAAIRIHGDPQAPPTDEQIVDVRVKLAERFLVPPFTVLDARQGYWQSRKRAWLALGIKSELGRGDHLHTHDSGDWAAEHGYNSRTNIHGRKSKAACNPGAEDTGCGSMGKNYKQPSGAKSNSPGGSPRPATKTRGGKTQRGDGTGNPMGTSYNTGGPAELGAEFRAKETASLKGGLTFGTTFDPYRVEPQEGETASLQGGCTFGTTVHPYDGGQSQGTQTGTSIFDPVLCELVYRWFSPPKAAVLDPFAGGSVRGIVASVLERHYTGIELRPEQTEANEQQAQDILVVEQHTYMPQWHTSDAGNLLADAERQQIEAAYDLIFTCPPYADLERYSDDPRDLSTLDYPHFLERYAKVIADACSLLRNDRFACVVVGDVRSRQTGLYHNFPDDTVRCFEAAGMALYNEAILITAIGSLPLRVGIQFHHSRKLGKTHQQLLVFVKGDPVRATDACGAIEQWTPADLQAIGVEVSTDETIQQPNDGSLGE